MANDPSGRLVSAVYLSLQPGTAHTHTHTLTKAQSFFLLFDPRTQITRVSFMNSTRDVVCMAKNLLF
jgi:hypothetical protein